MHCMLTQMVTSWHAASPFGAMVNSCAELVTSKTGSNPYARLVDEAEGLDKIEELQNHTNEDIYEKVVAIMESFFDVEDGEVENLAPQVRCFSCSRPMTQAVAMVVCQHLSFVTYPC